MPAALGAVGLFSLVWLMAAPTSGQQTELSSSFEEDTYCSESPPDTLDDLGMGCGYTFYQFTGRVSWPPLTYVAPITISVQTLETYYTAYPLYIEVEWYRGVTGCSTLLAGRTVLIANGLWQCGGTWETIGPLDLTQLIGLPRGWQYLVQLVFLRSRSDRGSVGVARIHVTHTPTSVATESWGKVKALYR